VAAVGVTARFSADIAGWTAASPEFCTTIGYRPGVANAPGGIAKDRLRLLVMLGAIEVPLKSAVVAEGLKYPPVRVTVGLALGFCDTLSGDEATMDGRIGVTLSASGPGLLGLPLWRSTETCTCPAADSRLPGIVARRSVPLIYVVVTADAACPGAAAKTWSVVKKLEPVRYTSCCAEPCEVVIGSMLVSTASDIADIVTVAVPDFVESAADVAVIVTLPVGTVVGAKYSPAVQGCGAKGFGQMNPVEEFPPAIPFTCQLKPVLVVPVTVAVNCCVLPALIVAVEGTTCTRTPESISTFAMPK
jgi:hypothetical protein